MKIHSIAAHLLLSLAFLFAAASALSARGNSSQPTFRGLAFSALGNGAPAVGDFNGDGKLDIALAAGGGAEILLGNGDGTFNLGGFFPAGLEPLSIATGDFNGDGKLDLVLSDAESGAVFILLGNGDGTFQPAKSFASQFPTAQEVSIVVADFNHDGKLDVAVADEVSCTPSGGGCNTIEVFLGNGDGTLQAPRLITLGSQPVEPTAIAVGDFNNDGNEDVAVVSGTPGGTNDLGVLWIALGNGDGTFQTPVATAALPESNGGLFGVAVGKFNNSSANLDVVAVAPFTGYAIVLLGNGNGTFQAPVTYNAVSPESVVVADFNGDGKPDLAVGLNGQFAILLGNGDGTFQTEVTHLVNNTGVGLGANPTNLAVADFNADSKPDLAMSTGLETGTLTVMTNTTNVSPAPVALASAMLTPSTIPGGGISTSVATLAAGSVAPTSGLILSVADSDTSVAQTFNNVTSIPVVSEMANNILLIGTNSGTTATTNVDISFGLSGVTQTAVLTVEPPSPPVALASLVLVPPTVTGGTAGVDYFGTVTLNEGAPFGGATVTATSSNTSVATVGSAFISAFNTSSGFGITTNPVSVATPVTISASYGGVTKSATLTVVPPVVSSMTIYPTTLSGGTSTEGTVYLTGPAPSGGEVVTLTSSNTSVATVPASLTVPAGFAYGPSFTISTSAVTTTQTVTISASLGGVTISATLTITPAPAVTVSSVILNPASVTGGNSSQGTVTLTAAPSSNTSVNLSSSNSSAATVPASVIVAAGSTSATFTVSTQTVTTTTSAVITATLGSSSAQATLTVMPAAAVTLSSLTLNPTSVSGGSSSTGTVTLSGNAPSGGAVVTLTSGDTSVATVPSSVTVAAGSTSATFTVSTQRVSTNTNVTISGSYGGANESATLTVTSGRHH